MDAMTTTEVKNKVEESIHHILAHSYSFYFLLLLISVFLDLAFPIRIFNSSAFDAVGFFMLLIASIIIIWAQKTSRNLVRKEDIKAEHFCRGPYCYTRSPTHWGLFILMLGFAIISNAFFVLVATLIAMAIAKLVFLKKEEALLANKYGESYLEYKKMVRF